MSSTTVIERVAALNRSGSLSAPLRYSDVKAALESVGEIAALQILTALEEESSSVGDPVDFVLKACAAAESLVASGRKRKASGMDRDAEGSRRAFLHAKTEPADGHTAVKTEAGTAVKTEFGSSHFGVKAEDLTELDKIERRLSWMNKNGQLSALIDVDRVLPPLNSIGFRQAMRVLRRLEESGSEVEPNEFIIDLVARAGWIWASPEVIDDDEKVAKRVAWMNQFGGLRRPIDWTKVADSLDSLRVPHAMVLLRELEVNAATIDDPTKYIQRSVGDAGDDDIKIVEPGAEPEPTVGEMIGLPKTTTAAKDETEERGLGLEDPVAYTRAMAQKRKRMMVKSEGTDEEDDVQRLSNRIAWLNNFGDLRAKIKANEVVGALYCLGVPQSMEIMRRLQMNASAIPDPTAYIKQQMKDVAGMTVAAKEEDLEGVDDGEPDGEDAAALAFSNYDDVAAEAAELAGGYDEADEAEDDFMGEAAALADEYDDDNAVVGQAPEEEAPKKLWPSTTDHVKQRVVGAITGITKCVPRRSKEEEKKGPESLIKEEPVEDKNAGAHAKIAAARKANMPVTPQEKLVQIRKLALKCGLELDEVCLKSMARLPFYKSRDLIDDVLLGGRTRTGVRNPSRYITLQIQKTSTGLGVEQGIAMELAVSLGVVLNNDALDELASIPRKEAHNLIRMLAKDVAARQDPMEWIRVEVEKIRVQSDARPFGSA